MQIKYSPFIDKQVTLTGVTVDLDGTVTIHGYIGNKEATLALSPKEAAVLFREFKKHDVEALARVHA